jgi:hypothetical protein
MELYKARVSRPAAAGKRWTNVYPPVVLDFCFPVETAGNQRTPWRASE